MCSSFTDPNILASEGETNNSVSSFGVQAHSTPDSTVGQDFDSHSNNSGKQKDVGLQTEMRPVNSDVSGLAGGYFRVGSGINKG